MPTISTITMLCTTVVLLAAGSIYTPSLASAMVTQPKQYKVKTSNWGATGAEVKVEKAAVKLRFDCADGEISRALTKDRKGDFQATGTYTRRRGPIRIGKPAQVEDVIYKGKFIANAMHLTIISSANDSVIADFTLSKGTEARLRVCR